MNRKDLEGLYDAYILRKIDQGLRDIEAGRTLTEAEFDQRMAKWLRTPESAP